MAQSEIKIQFKIENAEYKKGIDAIKNETKTLNKEFQLEQAQLKLTGTETDKLESKMTFLNKKYELTARQVKETEDQLQRAKSAFGENSKEVKTLEDSLLDAKIAYEKTGNEIANTNKKLDESKDKWKNASKAVGDFGKGAENAGNKLAPVSTAAAGAFAGIVGIAVGAGKAADDINTMAKVTGLSVEEIQKFQFAADTIDVSLDTMTGALTKVTKNMSGAKDGTGPAAEAFGKLGVSVVDSSGNLRDNEDVFYESIDALGKMTNETERDALAMEIFGKSATELNPLILGGADALREMGDAADAKGLILSQEELDKANALNDTLDLMKAETLQGLMQIGSDLAPVLIPMFESIGVAIGAVITWFQSLDEGTMKTILVILGIVAVIAPVLIIIGKVATGISGIMTLIGMLGPVFALLTGPIGIVIAIVAAVIAIGVLLYKNWDWLKGKAGELWSSISGTFNNIKESIGSAINSARDTVKGAIDKIKGFFNFTWALPKLKMPTFSMTGKFSLNPPSIPKLGINWNADGGIFTKPTVLNTSQGLQGFGEAGAEAILPISKLAGIIKDLMPEAYASTAGGTMVHEVGGNLNLNLSGQSAGLLNVQAIADEVLGLVLQNITQGNRSIPNRAGMMPF